MRSSNGSELVRVLIIDDDVAANTGLRSYLISESLETECVDDLQRGIEQIVHGHYSLVLLGTGGCGHAGWERLRQIRSRSEIPVMVVTDRSHTVDRIVALELGADDLVAKPFDPREVVARINAILRRVRLSSESVDQVPRVLTVDDIEIDSGTRVVFCGGCELELTALEFDLLHSLVRKAGLVVSREELSREVLGREFSPVDRSIDVHVSRLRRKLGRNRSHHERIKTVRSVGYMYVCPIEGHHR